jgi:hypothetical protein
MQSSGRIHGGPSTSDLAILGACLLLLPWMLFYFGARGLWLYLSLGLFFTIIVFCLNYRELWKRLRTYSPMPQPSVTELSNKENTQTSLGLSWQETQEVQEAQIVSAMVAGCSNWRNMSND